MRTVLIAVVAVISLAATALVTSRSADARRVGYGGWGRAGWGYGLGRGWVYHGWGRGVGTLAAGAVVGGALATPYYYYSYSPYVYYGYAAPYTYYDYAPYPIDDYNCRSYDYYCRPGCCW
jgi:hypothetical protein